MTPPPVQAVRDLGPLLARLSPTGAGRRLVGIAGAPGSGKSTLAAALVEALGPACALVPMDGFHLAQAELERLGRAGRKGAPDTFDAHGYVALLDRLRTATGETVYAPRFDRGLEEPVAGAVPVAPAVTVVLTEGNYLLDAQEPWDRVRQLLDEVWFVRTDEALRLERLVRRHVAHGRTPEAAAAWVARTDQPNAERIAPTCDRADLVLDLTDWPGGAGPGGPRR